MEITETLTIFGENRTGKLDSIFVDVFVFDGRQRELVQSTVKKTDWIYLKGALKHNRVTDDRGQQKNVGFIIAKSITILRNNGYSEGSSDQFEGDYSYR